MRRSHLRAVFVMFARAYIDPGTGFIIVTSVLGVITSISYFFRTSINRLKRLFTSGAAADSDAGAVADVDQPEPDDSQS